MRRIVLVLVLVAVLALAGYMLLKPKGAAAKPKSTTALADSSQYGGSTFGASAKAARPGGSKTAKGTGKVAGKLKASSAADRTAKSKQIKDAERARKKELARQAREKKKLLSKSARTRRGGRTTRKGAQLYVLKAIVAAGSENYGLVDSRKVQVGDFVLGRKIVGISPDRMEVEAFGKLSTVRIGESLVPTAQ